MSGWMARSALQSLATSTTLQPPSPPPPPPPPPPPCLRCPEHRELESDVLRRQSRLHLCRLIHAKSRAHTLIVAWPTAGCVLAGKEMGWAGEYRTIPVSSLDRTEGNKLVWHRPLSSSGCRHMSVQSTYAMQDRRSNIPSHLQYHRPVYGELRGVE